MLTETVIVAIITAVFGSGIGAAVVAFIKDRKKDNATAKLTDVQALQQQLILLTQVTDFLRKENAQLIIDYRESEENRRKMRERVAELEAELQKVKASAHRTQEQCDALSRKLKEFVNGEDS